MEKIDVKTLFNADQLTIAEVEKFVKSSECWYDGKTYVVGPKDSYKHVAVSIVDDGEEVWVNIYKTTVIELVEALRHANLVSMAWFLENRPTTSVLKKPITLGGAIMRAYREYKKAPDTNKPNLLEEGYM